MSCQTGDLCAVWEPSDLQTGVCGRSRGEEGVEAHLRRDISPTRSCFSPPASLPVSLPGSWRRQVKPERDLCCCVNSLPSPAVCGSKMLRSPCTMDEPGLAAGEQSLRKGTSEAGDLSFLDPLSCPRFPFRGEKLGRQERERLPVAQGSPRKPPVRVTTMCLVLLYLP